MTTLDIASLLVDTESELVERKATLTAGSNKDRICEAICAFANDLPNHNNVGVIFVGANDNGSCANLDITDQLLSTLADLRSNGNIHPFPMMSVTKENIDGCEFAVIKVIPSDAPPIRYKGVTCIRVGSRRGIATQEEERRLTEKRRAKTPAFELQYVHDATINDFDMKLFEEELLPSVVSSEILKENQRTRTEQLASLRFVVSADNPIPTVLGILCISNKARDYLPGVYVQFLRIHGNQLGDPIINEKTIEGPLPRLLSTLDEIIEINIQTSIDITSENKEIQSPDYPLAALQQIIRNAVLHRNYEGTNAPVRITWFNDRVEIQSPGGPYGQVTKENMGQPGVTDYRNPNIAEYMKALGYVQKFGYGISTAKRELERNGNPDLELFSDDTYVLATIRRKA